MEEKLLYTRGNLYSGLPYAVKAEGAFGSYELHGPFSGENEAWNYAMGLANTREALLDYSLVRIEITADKPVVSAAEILKHRERDALITKATGIAPGESMKIDLPEDLR